MAAATEDRPSKDILSEVRNFLAGSTKKKSISHESLNQSALYLLQTLPTARHAVLEYLCNLFDEAAGSHIQHLHSKSADTDDTDSSFDGMIQDACGVLFNFIKSNPTAWAPIISAWSLELLGHISCKYSTRHGMPQSLNELLQLWMTCTPTKSLMEVATECFAAMVSESPDVCVDALLEASVKYSPHFDWVVAHIGSCFPHTIITRVLMCGLKDFCHHRNTMSEMSEVPREENIPKMASVVGILGHLASKHSQDIKNALMKLFEESMKSGSEIVKVTTLPFLLQLGSMSNMLLQVLTTDLIKSLVPSVLNRLHENFHKWRQQNIQEYDSLIILVVHMIMKSDVGAYQVLAFLLNIASPEENQGEKLCPEVQEVAAFIMNQLLSDMQRMVFQRHRTGAAEIPLLSSLTSQVNNITKLLLKSDGPKGDWLLRLLSCLGLYCGEDLTTSILVHIMSASVTHKQLSRFVQLQGAVEVKLGDVLPSTVRRITDKLRPHKLDDPLIILNNILTMLQWEKKASEKSCQRSSFTYCLKSSWESLLPLVSSADLEVAMTTLNVLYTFGLPSSISSPSALHLCSALVKCFFRLLEFTEERAAASHLKLCRDCLKRLSKQSYIQSIILRMLIESLFIEDSAILFGAKVDMSVLKTASDNNKSVMLLQENQKHGLSLTLQHSHSSVFHAGIIGQGLRASKKMPILSKEHVERNKKYFVDLLRVCCLQKNSAIAEVSSPIKEVAMETDAHSGHISEYKFRLSGDLCRMVGSLITEIITPDVLYNNRFWPEEESIPMTVERDLYVLNQFEENPVLWNVMELFSSNSLAMCRCSPVLKSVTAALMNFFENSRLKNARDTPKQLEATCCLVRCLSKSCLLPVPLRYIAELFPLSTSYEAYLLLLSVWRFMKENPPTEDPEEVSRRVCEGRHTEIVRTILQSNIEKMGQFYARFFSTAV